MDTNVKRSETTTDDTDGFTAEGAESGRGKPRITQRGEAATELQPANRRAKDWLLDFAKLSECDTSPYRFGSNRVQAQKRCEDARHSKSTSSEIPFLNPRQLA